MPDPNHYLDNIKGAIAQFHQSGSPAADLPYLTQALQNNYDSLNSAGYFKNTDPKLGHVLRANWSIHDPTQGGAVDTLGDPSNPDPYGNPPQASTLSTPSPPTPHVLPPPPPAPHPTHTNPIISLLAGTGHLFASAGDEIGAGASYVSGNTTAHNNFVAGAQAHEKARTANVNSALDETGNQLAGAVSQIVPPTGRLHDKALETAHSLPKSTVDFLPVTVPKMAKAAWKHANQSSDAAGDAWDSLIGVAPVMLGKSNKQAMHDAAPKFRTATSALVQDVVPGAQQAVELHEGKTWGQVGNAAVDSFARDPFPLILAVAGVGHGIKAGAASVLEGAGKLTDVAEGYTQQWSEAKASGDTATARSALAKANAARNLAGALNEAGQRLGKVAYHTTGQAAGDFASNIGRKVGGSAFGKLPPKLQTRITDAYNAYQAAHGHETPGTVSDLIADGHYGAMPSDGSVFSKAPEPPAKTPRPSIFNRKPKPAAAPYIPETPIVSSYTPTPTQSVADAAGRETLEKLNASLPPLAPGHDWQVGAVHINPDGGHTAQVAFHDPYTGTKPVKVNWQKGEDFGGKVLDATGLDDTSPALAKNAPKPPLAESLMDAPHATMPPGATGKPAQATNSGSGTPEPTESSYSPTPKMAKADAAGRATLGELGIELPALSPGRDWQVGHVLMDGDSGYKMRVTLHGPRTSAPPVTVKWQPGEDFGAKLLKTMGLPDDSPALAKNAKQSPAADTDATMPLQGAGRPAQAFDGTTGTPAPYAPIPDPDLTHIWNSEGRAGLMTFASPTQRSLYLLGLRAHAPVLDVNHAVNEAFSKRTATMRKSLMAQTGLNGPKVDALASIVVNDVNRQAKGHPDDTHVLLTDNVISPKPAGADSAGAPGNIAPGGEGQPPPVNADTQGERNAGTLQFTGRNGEGVSSRQDTGGTDAGQANAAARPVADGGGRDPGQLAGEVGSGGGDEPQTVRGDSGRVPSPGTQSGRLNGAEARNYPKQGEVPPTVLVSPEVGRAILSHPDWGLSGSQLNSDFALTPAELRDSRSRVSPTVYAELEQNLAHNDGYKVAAVIDRPGASIVALGRKAFHEGLHTLQERWPLAYSDIRSLEARAQADPLTAQAWENAKKELVRRGYTPDKYWRELPAIVAAGDWKKFGMPYPAAKRLYDFYVDTAKQRHGPEAALEFIQAAPLYSRALRRAAGLPKGSTLTGIGANGKLTFRAPVPVSREDHAHASEDTPQNAGRPYAPHGGDDYSHLEAPQEHGTDAGRTDVPTDPDLAARESYHPDEWKIRRGNNGKGKFIVYQGGRRGWENVAVYDTMPEAEAHIGLKAEPQKARTKTADLSAPEDQATPEGEPDDTFYSHLAAVAHAKLPVRGSAAQVRQTLTGAGVGEEELKYTGVDALLKEREAAGQPVTKAGVLATVEENEPGYRYREHWKAETINREVEAARDILERELHEIDHVPEGILNAIASEVIAQGGKFKPAKMLKSNRHNYQILRSVLPERTDAWVAAINRSALAAKAGELPVWQRFTMPNGSNYREAILTHDRFPGGHTYEHEHWDGIENPALHLRMSDRAGMNGERILHLEEVQSDINQEGRESGYKQSTLPAGYQVEPADGEPGYFEVISPDNKVVAREKGEARARAAALKAHNSEAVPDAPFKTSWHGNGLKFAVHHAVKGGYDGVAWTPGPEQAERYGLSAPVSELSYRKIGTDSGEARYEIGGEDLDGEPLDIASSVPEKDLVAHVGKEVAAQILAGEGMSRGGEKTLRFGSEKPVVIGGKGMTGFYGTADEPGILHQAANKLYKRDGARVGKTTINIDPDTGDKTLEVPYLPITDALRKRVLSEGQPLFGNAPKPQGARRVDLSTPFTEDETPEDWKGLNNRWADAPDLKEPDGTPSSAFILALDRMKATLYKNPESGVEYQTHGGFHAGIMPENDGKTTMMSKGQSIASKITNLSKSSSGLYYAMLQHRDAVASNTEFAHIYALENAALIKKGALSPEQWANAAKEAAQGAEVSLRNIQARKIAQAIKVGKAVKKTVPDYRWNWDVSTPQELYDNAPDMTFDERKAFMDKMGLKGFQKKHPVYSVDKLITDVSDDLDLPTGHIIGAGRIDKAKLDAPGSFKGTHTAEDLGTLESASYPLHHAGLTIGRFKRPIPLSDMLAHYYDTHPEVKKPGGLFNSVFRNSPVFEPHPGTIDYLTGHAEAIGEGNADTGKTASESGAEPVQHGGVLGPQAGADGRGYGSVPVLRPGDSGGRDARPGGTGGEGVAGHGGTDAGLLGKPDLSAPKPKKRQYLTVDDLKTPPDAQSPFGNIDGIQRARQHGGTSPVPTSPQRLTVADLSTPAPDKQTPLEIIGGVRRASMLLSAKVFPKVGASHALHMISEEAANLPDAMLDMLVSKLTKTDRLAGGINAGAINRAAHLGATQGLREAKTILLSGEHGLKASGVQSPLTNSLSAPFDHTEFKSDIPALDKAVNTAYRLHGSFYHPLKVYALHRSIEAQADLYGRNMVRRGKWLEKDRKARTAYIVQHPDPEMVLRGVQAAEVSTFTNSNIFSSAWRAGHNKLMKGGPGGQVIAGLMDATSPFITVPSNIALRTLEYGLGPGAAMVYQVAHGMPVTIEGALAGALGVGGAKALAELLHSREFTSQNRIVLQRDIARGTIGAGIIYLGYLAARHHLLTASDEKHHKSAEFHLGGYSANVSPVQPTGNLFGLGAIICQMEEDRKLGVQPDTRKMISGLTSELPMAEDSLFQRWMEGEDPQRMGGDYASSFEPALLKNIAGQIDPYKREVNGPMDSIKAGIPFLRQTLPIKRDLFGQPIPHTNDLFDPFGVRRLTKMDTPAMQELTRFSADKPHDFGPQTDEGEANSAKKLELLKKARAGGDITGDLNAMVKSGAMSQSDANRFAARAKEDPRIGMFKRLSAPQAAYVYSLANPEEKKLLGEGLKKKLEMDEKRHPAHADLDRKALLNILTR